MTFKAGESGNKAGRPVGAKGKYTNSFLDKMIILEEKVAKEKGISLLEHFIRECHTDNNLLAQYLKKIVADRNYLTDKEDGSVQEPIKVEFETIETFWSAREAMVNRNREGLLNILKQLEKGEITATDALDKIGNELLKGKNICQATNS